MSWECKKVQEDALTSWFLVEIYILYKRVMFVSIQEHVLNRSIFILNVQTLYINYKRREALLEVALEYYWEATSF